MIPDSKIETTVVFWDTSPKNPGGMLVKDLSQFKRQSQTNAVLNQLKSMLSAF
jgi:hypothetical protein